MKNNSRNSRPSSDPRRPPSALVRLANDLDGLRTRQVAIQKRLGIIGAESAKLHAEQHGIELKRAAKQREFDNLSGL